MLNLAFFLGELELDSQRKVLSGIADAAKADGNNIVVYALTLSTDEENNEGESASMLFDDFSIYDGFIIYAESIYSEKIRNVVIEKIMKEKKPCASIDFFIDGVINVSSDNEGAMRTLSKHLIEEHKIKTVNFIGGPEDSVDARIRKRVFMEELEKVGLRLDTRRFYEGDYYARSGRTAVKYFESQGLLEADAYVCANDQMALGAFYALSDRGIRIPEDTILSGYDNIFEAANHYPRLTTINRYEEKIGEMAYRNVVLAIEGKEYDSNPVIFSDPVYGESCGCRSGCRADHRQVMNKYSRSKLREARFAEMINDLTVDLTSARSPEDIFTTVKPCIPELGGDAFILTIFNGRIEDREEFQSCASVLSYEEGGFRLFKDVVITERHPKFDDNSSGNIFIVYSLHYRERFYGFTAIRNSVMPLYSEFYRILMMTLSSALEQVNNVMKMQGMIKTLDEMWVFDPMTHVYNRAGFFKFSEKILEEAKRDHEDLFFIFLDLDGLKKVNDALGHETGDRMICDMADVLRKNRNKEELLMRYGGDEFVVFGKGLTEEELKKYVEKIRRSMAELNAPGNRQYRVDASIGFNIVPFDNDKPLSALIELADQDMYREKRAKHSHA